MQGTCDACSLSSRLREIPFLEIRETVSSEKTQRLRKVEKERPGKQSSLSEKTRQGFPTAPADVPSPSLHKAPQGRDVHSSLTLSGSEKSRQPSLQSSPTPAGLHALGIQEALLHVKKTHQVPAPWKSVFLLTGCRQFPLTASLCSASSLHCSPWFLGLSDPAAPQYAGSHALLTLGYSGAHPCNLSQSTLQAQTELAWIWGVHSCHQYKGEEMVTEFGWGHD